jgi:hypothetical protein
MIAAATTVTEPQRARPGTLRVQHHRRRRREGLRLFTVEVPEATIAHAIARGLLKPDDRAKPFDRAKPLAVIQACYAAQLADGTLNWLIDGGVITHEQRGDAAAILRGISAWLEQANR